jgi:putative FmdB family regulatory protein
MPIYEYECTKCGKIEEVLQKFSDKPLIRCKYCSARLHKLISHSTFHLKGTGWYVTDYANKSKSAPATSKEVPDTSSKKSSASTSEKKTSKKSTE